MMRSSLFEADSGSLEEELAAGAFSVMYMPCSLGVWEFSEFCLECMARASRGLLDRIGLVCGERAGEAVTGGTLGC